MARKKISQLPLDNAVIGTDVVPIVSDGATKRVQLSTLGAYFDTVIGPDLPAGTEGDVLTYVSEEWVAAAPQGAFDQSLNTTDGVQFASVSLPNATQLVVGSFDNMTGGANGISLICAVGYELNWQGGRLRSVAVGGDGTPQTIYCDSPVAFQAGATGLSYDDLDDLPATFPPSSHTHDDRYYTESEADTLLATKLASSDASVTNAREWTADTVSQAEAEAGTATTRRAFTALRVFQAIAAWWAASAAKTKLDGIASGATANATDAQLRDRSTHTGYQTAATISDFVTSAASAAPVQSVNGQTGAVTIASYSLPVATSSVLGGVKQGSNVTIDGSGVISVAAPYSLPTASASVLGGIKVGSGLSIDGSGVLTATYSYTLPAATTSTLGGVIVGTGLAVSSGTVSVSYGSSSGTACQGNDSRLSDTRTPTDGSVTDAKITSGGLSASSINWTAIAAWAPSTAYAKGDIVSYLGVAYRRSAAGTSGSVFSPTSWQQVTPSEFVGSQITSGTIPIQRLGTGSPSSSNFLRGDGTFASAGSTSASDLTSGTLSDQRLSTNAQAAINLYLWSSFR